MSAERLEPNSPEVFDRIARVMIKEGFDLEAIRDDIPDTMEEVSRLGMCIVLPIFRTILTCFIDTKKI